MSSPEPFMSEIRIMSFGFAPKGWAQCNGQLLPINQNQALFSLLGTTFGGDGRVNFALPDLRGNVTMIEGAGFVLGQKGGEQAHTLSASEMPAHPTRPWPVLMGPLRNCQQMLSGQAILALHPMGPRQM